MNPPSREEFDLHLQRWDEKLDGHLKLVDERICSQTALFVQWRESEQRVADERHKRLADTVHEIQVENRQCRDDSKAEAKSLKTVIVTTAIGTIIAIVGGVAALNATILSNMVASFESGRNAAAVN